MGHGIAVRIKETSKELEVLQEQYKKMKLKTTKNFYKGLELKKKIINLETKVAVDRSAYLRHLESSKRMKSFKQLWED